MTTTFTKKHYYANFLASKYHLIIFVLLLLAACASQTKESYLQDYQDFMQDVKEHYDTYSQKDWQAKDEKFKKFSEEWYEDYKEDLTWKEQLRLGKYALQYNLYKLGGQSGKSLEEFFGKDFDKLKKQVQYYKEHQMDKDIEELTKQAKDLGKEAQKTLDEIFKELDMDSKNQK